MLVVTSLWQPTTADGTAATTNGNSMWVNFALNDAYANNDLAEGNIVATATNGALLPSAWTVLHLLLEQHQLLLHMMKVLEIQSA
jgi:hypothetical protein